MIESIEDWGSPRLGIWFVVTPETWEIYRPDGSRFLTDVELGQRLEEPQQQLQTAQAKADRLADRLCTLGIDPSEV